MAHKKSGGSTKNLQDSNPKYLGIKVADGGQVKAGGIIVRQRGTKIVADDNVRMGTDHTLYALIAGRVKFGTKRKGSYDGKIRKLKSVSVK